MLGDRLHQARLLAGMTQEALATALTQAGYSATNAVISKYENHKSTPSAQFLLLAASILNVPVSYFTHESNLEVKWLAFRRHSGLPSGEQETVKQYATDVGELQIELQSLLYPNMTARLPERVKVVSLEDAERAAMNLRALWRLDDNPIDSLVRTAEEHQVVVVGWDKYAGELDGLSGWCNEIHPITVVNTAVDAERRRFTLAHELGHLVMDTDSVTEKESEKFANRFAATFLVPADRAKYELGARRTNIDWDELKILKRKYGLSIAAWIHRAAELEIITKNYANTLLRELDARGWRNPEPIEYIWDESPLKLEQMAHRALSEGLISPDQISRVNPAWLKQEVSQPTERFTIYDLLKLPEEEQKRLMDEAFALASTMDIEIFEANEFLEENEGLP